MTMKPLDMSASPTRPAESGTGAVLERGLDTSNGLDFVRERLALVGKTLFLVSFGFYLFLGAVTGRLATLAGFNGKLPCFRGSRHHRGVLSRRGGQLPQPELTQLLDLQPAKEVDEVTSVLSKNFGRTLLTLLGGREDKNIYATVPERLLVFVSGVHLIAARPEAVHDLKDTADQP